MTKLSYAETVVDRKEGELVFCGLEEDGLQTRRNRRGQGGEEAGPGPTVVHSPPPRHRPATPALSAQSSRSAKARSATQNTIRCI